MGYQGGENDNLLKPSYAKWFSRILSYPISKSANLEPHKFKPKPDIVSLIRHYNDMATLLHSPAADFDLQYLKSDGETSNQKQFYTYLGKQADIWTSE